MGPLCRRSRPAASRGLRLPLWMQIALAGALAAPLAHAAPDSTPFAIRSHDIEGLIIQVWPLSVSRCPGGETDLLVLSTEGGPPHQRKLLTWMPCGSALRTGDSRILQRELPAATVVVDVARIPGRSGPQLLIVTADGIRMESLGGDEPPGRLEVPGGLPLPARPWEIARLPIVEDWGDNGSPSLLVPGLRGGWLIDPATGAARELPMPVYGEYQTRNPFLPAVILKWMIAETTWPTLARADDNGDGRLDLFALSRFAIWIYHAGPEGLPSEPSRRIALVPFDEETERRHEATGNNYFARDLDGDGRADLLLSTIGGGLLDGRSDSKFHLNGGSGVTVNDPPDARRLLEGGISGFDFADIDGDGRVEILETGLEFGILQIVRLLLTRNAETTVRVLTLDREAEGGLRTLFEDDFSFRLDFDESQVSGLIPSLGDWNGDGILDLYVPRGSDEIGFRFGTRDPDEPLFGRVKERQPVPLESGETRVADLDGDGLDEIVAFTDRDPDQPLVVFQNLGRLPGTRPALRGPTED